MLRASALLLLLVLPLNDATAVPVRVLSRTRAELDVQKRWNALNITGVLRDDRGAPMVFAEVALSIPGLDAPRTTITDAGGRFTFSLEGPALEQISGEPGEDVELTVRFGGDSTRGPTTAVRTIDLSRETLQIQAVVTPPRLPAGDAPRVLAVLRRGAEPAPDLPLTATISRVGDGADGPSSRVYTGSDGRAVFRAFEPPPPGEYRVRVEFAGSRRFNPVVIDRDLTVITRTSVSLERVDDGADPLAIRVRGTLTAAGEPLAGSVTLSLNDTAYTYADADETGRFEASLLGPADGRLRAIFTPTESWEVGSVSPAIALPIPAPPRVPLAIYVVPLLILAGVLALIALVRSGELSRIWPALLAWLKRRPAPRPAAPRAGAEVIPRASPKARPVPPDTIGGVVWDTDRDLPLAGASVVLIDTGVPSGEETAGVSSAGEAPARFEARSDPDGRFALGPLPAGSYRVRVERAGFVGLETTVRSGRSWRLRLLPLRVLTGRAWASLIEDVAPDRLRFGAETPADAAPVLVEQGQADAALVTELTARVEAIYWGGDDRVTPTDHEQAVALMDRVREAGG